MRNKQETEEFAVQSDWGGGGEPVDFVFDVLARGLFTDYLDTVSTGTCNVSGRRGGLMVSALESGASGPGSSPGRGHCGVFLGKTLYSHAVSLHPGL